MKVIIFGATGTVGALAVRRMLADGHQVAAFARHPERLEINDPALRRVAGDAADEAAVAEAIAGHDAVVVTLGAGTSRKSVVRSTGTMNVIRGMQAHGVSRLICQSTLGAHESWSNLNFFWKRIMFGLLLRPAYADHQRQEEIVAASGLDWTLVRPSAFTDGPATNQYLHGFAPTIKGLALKISRADVAGFVLRQLTDQTYLGRAANLSN